MQVAPKKAASLESLAIKKLNRQDACSYLCLNPFVDKKERFFLMTGIEDEPRIKEVHYAEFKRVNDLLLKGEEQFSEMRGLLEELKIASSPSHAARVEGVLEEARGVLNILKKELDTVSDQKKDYERFLANITYDVSFAGSKEPQRELGTS